MNIETVGALVACAGLLAGCNQAAHEVVSKPSDITLRQALIATIDAMAAARAEARQIQDHGVVVPVSAAVPGGTVQQNGTIQQQYTTIPVGAIGINPCTVTATFNIAASGTSVDSQGGTLSAAPKFIPVSAALTVTNSNTLGTSRGNQVSVVFTTPACNPTGALGTTNPAAVTLLQREIDSARTGAPDPVGWPQGDSPVTVSGTVVPKGDLTTLNRAASYYKGDGDGPGPLLQER